MKSGTLNFRWRHKGSIFVENLEQRILLSYDAGSQLHAWYSPLDIINNNATGRPPPAAHRARPCRNLLRAHYRR